MLIYMPNEFLENRFCARRMSMIHTIFLKSLALVSEDGAILAITGAGGFISVISV